MNKMHIFLSVLAISTAVSIPAQQAQEAYERAMKVYAVDAKASIQLFQRAAKLGSADAMVRLGHIYQTAEKPNSKYAIMWYTKAVEAGSLAAIYEVGALYEYSNRGSGPDLPAAIEWYERGVSNNSLKSCEALARIYASADDISLHDGTRAVKYAEILLKKDARNAAYMDLAAAAYARNLDFPNALKAASLAISLSPLDEAAGRRLRKEQYEEGMPYPAMASESWILQAAEQENLWAVMQLAEMSGDELSGDYDPTNARHWYEIGAENGNPEALLKLGYMCFSGEGGEVDLKKAFWCFSRAAEAARASAYAPLGRMHIGGKGTGQDFEKAQEWYQKAIDSEFRQYGLQLSAIKWMLRTPVRPSPDDLYETAQTMATSSLNLRGEEKTYSQRTNEILQRYWLAAEQDHIGAMQELADMFFYGKRYFVREGELNKNTGGVPSNFSRALDYYRQLQRRGIESAEMETCKELYLVELKDDRERQRKRVEAKRAAERKARNVD